MEILDALGISPVVAIMQVVIFLGFYFVIKQFLFTPIMKIINARDNLINSKNKEIETIGKKIDELEQKINSILAESDKDVLKVEEGKLKEMLHKKSEVVTKLQEEFLANIVKLRQTFEIERVKLIEELDKILEPIKEDILSKLTYRN